MTKDELKKFVRIMYATWNQTLLQIDEAPTYEAWWLQMEDCEYDHAITLLKTLGITEKYMPTPGHTKKAYLLTRKENPPPTPQQFWAHLQTLQKHTHNGTTQINPNETPHPCITETIRELGATALTLHTNQDREQAQQTYKQHVDKWLLQPTVAETK